eukprot:2097548-Alexandrium_andersonii.AAC.1
MCVHAHAHAHFLLRTCAPHGRGMKQVHHPSSAEGIPPDAVDDVGKPNTDACTAAQRVQTCCPPSAHPRGAARA